METLIRQEIEKDLLIYDPFKPILDHDREHVKGCALCTAAARVHTNVTECLSRCKVDAETGNPDATAFLLNNRDIERVERVTQRMDGEAFFGDWYSDYGLVGRLKFLTKYGFDMHMVFNEVTKYAPGAATVKRDPWQKLYHEEMVAALDYASSEARLRDEWVNRVLKIQLRDSQT